MKTNHEGVFAWLILYVGWVGLAGWADWVVWDAYASCAGKRRKVGGLPKFVLMLANLTKAKEHKTSCDNATLLCNKTQIRMCAFVRMLANSTDLH